jgi:hypothetical protein
MAEHVRILWDNDTQPVAFYDRQKFASASHLGWYFTGNPRIGGTGPPDDLEAMRVAMPASSPPTVAAVVLDDLMAKGPTRVAPPGAGSGR